MKKTLFILTSILVTSCMQEEKELIGDLILKTKSENIKLNYTLETIPKPRHTIDFDINKSSIINNENTAIYVASHAALLILERSETSKLEENEAIKIKFTNPNYPPPSTNDQLNYYSFDIADLRKAKVFIAVSEEVIFGYYNDFILLKAKMDTVQISKIDSVLKLILPKGKSLTAVKFLKFETLTDSLKNKYTAVVNSIITTGGQKNLTTLFNNKTGRIVEMNSMPI